MTEQEIIQTIKKLQTGFTNRTEIKATAAITEMATIIAPLMKLKNLQISKGDSSPSTQRSYDRIYLEKSGNTSHNPNHKECQENVISTYEWQVRSKYGFSPTSAKKIIAFTSELIDEVNAA